MGLEMASRAARGAIGRTGDRSGIVRRYCISSPSQASLTPLSPLLSSPSRSSASPIPSRGLRGSAQARRRPIAVSPRRNRALSPDRPKWKDEALKPNSLPEASSADAAERLVHNCKCHIPLPRAPHGLLLCDVQLFLSFLLEARISLLPT